MSADSAYAGQERAELPPTQPCYAMGQTPRVGDVVGILAKGTARVVGWQTAQGMPSDDAVKRGLLLVEVERDDGSREKHHAWTCALWERDGVEIPREQRP